MVCAGLYWWPLIGYWILRREARQPNAPLTVEAVDSLLNHVLLGVILGAADLATCCSTIRHFFWHTRSRFSKSGKAGWPFMEGFSASPLRCGCLPASTRYPSWRLVTEWPWSRPGLCLGRISNFINAELQGRVTDVPWAVVFAEGDGLARHPSQLYEAGLEGLVLGLVMVYGHRRSWLARNGRMTAILLAGYGLARFMIEFVREPDAQLGVLFGFITMGQILCLPMLAAGAYLVWRRV